MKVVKTLVKDFDSSNYALASAGTAPLEKKIMIRGTARTKNALTKDNKPYLTMTISDGEMSYLTFPVWSNAPAFSVASEANEKPVELCCVLSKKSPSAFMSVGLHNLSILDKLDVQNTEMDVVENRMNFFVACLSQITDPFYKAVVEHALENPSVVKNLAFCPATEKTAFNYSGGLVDLMSNSIMIAGSVARAINEIRNNDFSVTANPDALMASVVLCNLGRVETIQFNGTEIEKTRLGYLENDLVIAREIAKKAIEDTYLETVEDVSGNKVNKFTYDAEIVEDLLHTISSSRERPDYGALTLPRTFNANLVAQVLQIAHMRGTFDTINRTLREGEEFTRLYDGARVYMRP